MSLQDSWTLPRSAATCVHLALMALLGIALAGETPPARAAERITVVALFKGKAMVDIDGKRLLMVEGGKIVDGVRLLKADARGARLEVDGIATDYTLGQRISARFDAPVRKPLRLFVEQDGIYRSGGSINGKPVRFVVDTGATLIAMNRGTAERLGLDYRRGIASSAQTANGRVETFELMLDTVAIGHIQVRNVLGSVVDGDLPDEILLGNSFLSRINMRREGNVMELLDRGY